MRISLRPRYSLLTLLVLTALVAGGVKLWYGPHRVVEQTNPNTVVEYTYTRDWHWNKFIQGVKISRVDAALGEQRQINLAFFRRGQDTHQYRFILIHDSQKKFYVGKGVNGRLRLGLTPEERRDFDFALQQESAELQKQGYSEYQDDAPKVDLFLGSSG